MQRVLVSIGIGIIVLIGITILGAKNKKVATVLPQYVKNFLKERPDIFDRLPRKKNTDR